MCNNVACSLLTLYYPSNNSSLWEWLSYNDQCFDTAAIAESRTSRCVGREREGRREGERGEGEREGRREGGRKEEGYVECTYSVHVNY